MSDLSSVGANAGLEAEGIEGSVFRGVGSLAGVIGFMAGDFGAVAADGVVVTPETGFSSRPMGLGRLKREEGEGAAAGLLGLNASFLSNPPPKPDDVGVSFCAAKEESPPREGGWRTLAAGATGSISRHAHVVRRDNPARWLTGRPGERGLLQQLTLTTVYFIPIYIHPGFIDTGTLRGSTGGGS